MTRAAPDSSSRPRADSPETLAGSKRSSPDHRGGEGLGSASGSTDPTAGTSVRPSWFTSNASAREASYGDLESPLPDALRQVLEGQGISRLYSHQARAIDMARAGSHVVIATGTASGKSLAYHIPILERLLLEPTAVALYLFPTKALAQDQLRGLTRMAEASPALRRTLVAGTYDGDTPGQTRRRFREQANAILTNPDMLHQGILVPPAGAGFLEPSLRRGGRVRTYRGIFGCIANVLRRLRRARHYGSDPCFLLSSATFGIRETGRAFVGDEVSRGRGRSAARAQAFAFWNPKHAEGEGAGRERLDRTGGSWSRSCAAASSIVFTRRGSPPSSSIAMRANG